MQTITMDFLLNNEFELTGLEENVGIKAKKSGMFSQAELSMLPCSDADRLCELNSRISDMIFEKFGSTLQFSQKSNLNYETIRKYTRASSKKTLPKEMLAKFVIACELSVAEANELFVLREWALQPKRIRLDAVVVHCLDKHHDLDGFFETCKQVGLEIEYKI